MSNPYGWGQNEPQIKPKDQGGDTIATFSQKIYNLFDNLFNTLNSYPWSAATQSDAGYMSAADKAALDDVPTTYLPLSGGTLSGNLIFSTFPAYIRRNSDEGTLALYSGSASDKGGELVLYGKDTSYYPGDFQLRAKNGVNSRTLRGTADGTLTWDGKDVATIQTGNWTPVIYGSTTAGSFTYASQGGEYVKIGNLCYISMYIRTTAIGTAPAGNVRIKGLPFNGVTTQGGGNGVLSTIGNNSFRRINGGIVEGSYISLWANNSDNAYYKDTAVWGSSSDKTGYKVYEAAIPLYLYGWYKTT